MAEYCGPCVLTLTKRIQVFETKCLRKILHISYLENKTNDWVQRKINFLVGPKEPLLETVKRQKLARFGHITRYDSFSKTILQGTLKRWATPWSADETLDGQHQRVDSPANARLVTTASCRKDWKRIFAESSLPTPRRPNRSRD